jgi:hypothetical protein
MKKLIGFLIKHVKENFKLGIYLYLALFIALITFFAYRYHLNSAVLAKHYGSLSGILMYFLVNVVSYFGVAVPLLFFRKKQYILASAKFWIISLSILLLIAMERGFYFHHGILTAFSKYEEGLFVYHILSNFKGIVLFIPGLFILKLIYDRESVGLFGMRRKGAFMKPFFLMVLLILPMVTWASFQTDFQSTYPIFKPWRLGPLFELKDWQSVFLFETAYSFDFISVELIYRGALAIGMAGLLGKDAVLPMVSLYVAIHFGKPLAETISSAFGGYILGVIALNLRNIWGGAFIHIGLALLMEAAAFLQHYLR